MLMEALSFLLKIWGLMFLVRILAATAGPLLTTTW